MYYVIQENLFREYHFNTLIKHLERYKLDYELVKYRPFLHEVEVKTDRKDVFLFGSINAGMVLRHKDWQPGVLYNANFDYDICLQKFGNEMLNYGAKVKDFGIIKRRPDWTYFIRPTYDTKTFESKVYSVEEWNKYVEETIETKTFDDICKETKMLYCPSKDGRIQQEIRCWIVDGEPVTMSQYKIGRRVNLLNMDNNQEAYIYAKSMAKLFAPARAWVLDICLYNDDYKIVEMGCINHCGFYDADMSKLIQSLENAFANGNG